MTNTHHKPRAWVAWSSGKDSLWALHVARQSEAVEVVGLLTTVAETDLRIPMHGVREEILIAQAASLGLPLHRVPIPIPCPDEAYQQLMAEAMQRATGEGITHIIFGDLFLEDLRHQERQRMRAVAMNACFRCGAETPPPGQR
jgi:diphthamide synthase (EF-2-diphthine--ammonia ligase)